MTAIFKTINAIVLLPYLFCIIIFVIIKAIHLSITDPSLIDSFGNQVKDFVSEEKKNHSVRMTIISLLIWISIFYSF